MPIFEYDRSVHMTLSDIKARIGFAVTGDHLAAAGIQPAERLGRGCLYRVEDYPKLVDAICKTLQMTKLGEWQREVRKHPPKPAAPTTAPTSTPFPDDEEEL